MKEQDRPEGTPGQPSNDEPIAGDQPTSGDQPSGDQPATGDQPTSGDQPTTSWTRPSEPPPPPAPPPGEPAPPYSTGSGPILSATPSAPAGWTQPAVGGQEVAPGLVFSGTTARFAAYVTDSFLLGLAAGAITSTFASGAMFTPRGEFVWTTGNFVASILSVAINAAYFIAFWSGGRRATLGQMLFNIQVGNAFDGKPLTLEQAVRRWLGLGQFLSVFAISAAAVGLIGLVGLIWSLVLFFSTISSPTKQGLHDRFANSAVVRPAGAGNGLVYTCLIVIFIIPILAILAILSLIIVGSQTSELLSAIGTSVSQP